MNNYDELKKSFKKRLEKIKETARINRSPYDCIMGLSGGKDSTYVIYQLKRKYNLRVLAFTLYNGFHTDFLEENVKNAIIRCVVCQSRYAQSVAACIPNPIRRKY